MSGGQACRDSDHRRTHWVVVARRCNYSAFNGYRRTSSDYSDLYCQACGARWRTKAAYVATVPDGDIPVTTAG